MSGRIHSLRRVPEQEEYCAALEQREAAYGQLLEELHHLQGRAPSSDSAPGAKAGRCCGHDGSAETKTGCCAAAAVSSASRLPPTRIPKPMLNGAVPAQGSQSQISGVSHDAGSCAASLTARQAAHLTSRQQRQPRPAAAGPAAGDELCLSAAAEPAAARAACHMRALQQACQGPQANDPPPTHELPGGVPATACSPDASQQRTNALLLGARSSADSASLNAAATRRRALPQQRRQQPPIAALAPQKSAGVQIKRGMSGNESGQRVSAADLDRILGVTDEGPSDLPALLQTLHLQHVMRSPGF